MLPWKPVFLQNSLPKYSNELWTGWVGLVSFLKEKQNKTKQKTGFQGINFFLCEYEGRVVVVGDVRVCGSQGCVNGVCLEVTESIGGVGVSEFWTNGIFCVLILTSMSIHAAVLKGIFSDSINIFLCRTWIRRHQQKSLFPKFQLISILPSQVMHDYAVFHCSVRYVLLKLSARIDVKTSHWNDFSLIPLGKCVSWRRTIQIDEKKKKQVSKNLRAPSILNHRVCL